MTNQSRDRDKNYQNQLSAFREDLVFEKGFTKCNVNIISMKVGFAIEIIKPKN